MVGFGTVLGGHEVRKSPLMEAVDTAARVEPSIPPEERESFELVLVLHVPGSVLSDLGYEGIRTSSSFKPEKVAQIQVAVPADVVFSPDAGKWLVDTLRDAIDLCEKKCKRQKFPFDRSWHETSVRNIAKALNVTA